MTIESAGIKLKATLKLEKYEGNVTKEDIDNGKVKPIEVVVSEDDLALTKSQYKNLLKGDV